MSVLAIENITTDAKFKLKFFEALVGIFSTMFRAPSHKFWFWVGRLIFGCVIVSRARLFNLWLFLVEHLVPCAHYVVWLDLRLNFLSLPCISNFLPWSSNEACLLWTLCWSLKIVGIHTTGCTPCWRTLISSIVGFQKTCWFLRNPYYT